MPSATPIALVGAGTVVSSAPSGAFEEGTFHGVYHADQRRLSRYRLTMDGVEPNVLRSARRSASELDTALATSFNAHGDARGVLLRHRTVEGVMTDRYSVHRLVDGPAMELVIELGTDLAGMFDVKGGHVTGPGHPLTPVDERTFSAVADGGSSRPGPTRLVERGQVVLWLEVDGPAPDVLPDGGLRWQLDPAVGEVWELTLTFTPAELAGDRMPVTEMASRASLEVVTDDHRWSRAVRGAVDDLAALRVQMGDERYTAAGAPWFMALFGRDALLTAYAALPLGTDPVLDTLEALARRQGRRHDTRSLEQPGRILHELRTGSQGVFGLEPGEAYYGTTDATPLFVWVLAEAARWGADPDRVAALLPAARAAVTWCIEHGDVDGDGFVEAVADGRGIENQGWKDSGDSMVHADGSFAVPPIALVEVQAYLYGALEGLAELERHHGDPAAATELAERASDLRAAFLAAYWDDELDGLVMGLDREKRPLRVASSNMGHALWTGVLDDEHAARVAARITAPDLFDSWGIRTLGAGERAYAPLTYHRGAIWPHDSAIVAHGLARVGAQDGLVRLIAELLDLTERFDYRLPELLGGIGRGDLPEPVPYPVACSPQAWSAAVPLLLARAVLGFEPDVPAGVIRLSPAVGAAGLVVRGLRVGPRTLEVAVDKAGAIKVAGAEDLEVITGRP